MDRLLKGEFQHWGFHDDLGALSQFSEGAWIVCRQMLDPNVDSRISAHQALASDWLSPESIAYIPEIESPHAASTSLPTQRHETTTLKPFETSD
jgi:hypothetical protein